MSDDPSYLRPAPYQAADQEITVRIAPADLEKLLGQVTRLAAAIVRLEDAAARAAPGSAAYEALDEQLELLYQIAEEPPDARP